MSKSHLKESGDFDTSCHCSALGSGFKLFGNGKENGNYREYRGYIGVIRGYRVYLWAVKFRDLTAWLETSASRIGPQSQAR